MPFQPAVSEPPRLTYRLPEDISPAAVDTLDAMLSAVLQSGLALLDPPQQAASASKPTIGEATVAAENREPACAATTSRGRRCQRANTVDGFCKQHHNRRQADETETDPPPVSVNADGPDITQGNGISSHDAGVNATPVKLSRAQTLRRTCEHCGGLMKRQTAITAAGRNESLTCLSCGRDAPEAAVATA